MTHPTPRDAVLKLYGGCFFVITVWLLVCWTVVQLTPW